MSVLRYFTVFLAFVSTGVFASRPPRYRLSVSDLSVQRRFAVSLISMDDRPICIELRRWPNDVGHVHYGGDWVILHSSGGTYPAQDENFGRCVGPECILHIAPHGKLTGFVSYEMFGPPAAIARLSDRQLEFQIRPIACDLFPAATPTPNQAMQRTPTRRSPNISHD